MLRFVKWVLRAYKCAGNGMGGANPAVNTPRPSRGTRIESCLASVLLVRFILLGLACRVGTMGSIYLLCPTCCLRRLIVWGLIFLFFSYYLSRLCWLFWVLYFSLSFHHMHPFGVVSLWPREGVRVSWTSTDVRRYWAEIGTVFNVKTTTTTNIGSSAPDWPGTVQKHADTSTT